MTLVIKLWLLQGMFFRLFIYVMNAVFTHVPDE